MSIPLERPPPVEILLIPNVVVHWSTFFLYKKIHDLPLKAQQWNKTHLRSGKAKPRPSSSARTLTKPGPSSPTSAAFTCGSRGWSRHAARQPAMKAGQAACVTAAAPRVTTATLSSGLTRNCWRSTLRSEVSGTRWPTTI